MSNKKTAPKKTATKKMAKKVTKNVTTPKQSILRQEISAKNTFLLVLLTVFVIMAAVLIGF